MKFVFVTFLVCWVLTSCDCYRDASGVVLDKQTLQPVAGVGVGKFETEDPENPRSRKEHSNDSGQYQYTDISGGLGGCPDLVLYFTRPGYKTSKMRFPSFSKHDTVLLERTPGVMVDAKQTGN
jgi:hypothetical protein